MIKTEMRTNGTALMTLCDPARRNCLSTPLLSSLRESLVRLKENGMRCLIISGEGDHFSAGYDLGSLREDFSVHSPHAREGKTLLRLALDDIEKLDCPVIALIRGYCLGAGMETAAACDLRIAAEDSLFGMPPAKIGLIYPPSGIRRLARTVGEGFAREMFLTGRVYPAETMQRKGFLNETAAGSALEELALQTAAEISSLSCSSLGGMKRIFYQMNQGDESLQELTEGSLGDKDLAEGLSAFREKRKARFRED